MRGHVAFAVALITSLPFGLAADKAEPGQHPETFEKTITVKLDYLLYLPRDYDKDQDKKWPLIVFLHGSGESGSDVEMVKKHGPPKLLAGDTDLPVKNFVVVSPQCPAAKRGWNVDHLNMLLDDVLAKYRIDQDRVYLTGLSMGGFGTWSWAERDADRFAAIAPMCGGGDPARARRLKSMPIWVFHGEQDPVVPIRSSEMMVEAVQKAGNNDVKFTRYPDAGHDCWTRSYDNAELYEWFLQHKRTEHPARSEGGGR